MTLINVQCDVHDIEIAYLDNRKSNTVVKPDMTY